MSDGGFFDGFDGKALLDLMLIAEARKHNDKKTEKMMKVFQKYGLSIMDGFSMLLEIFQIIEDEKNDG